MKTKILLIALIISFTAVFASAQKLGKINAETQKQVGASLTKYYSLKDALVEGDIAKANAAADELLASLDSIDASKMNKEQRALWVKLEAGLRSDAKHISENDDIEHQRDHFKKLSNYMHSLVFSFKANETDAYVQYCPMKKASWLSKSKDIKNPYFGNKMLACGSVKTTLKNNK